MKKQTTKGEGTKGKDGKTGKKGKGQKTNNEISSKISEAISPGKKKTANKLDAKSRTKSRNFKTSTTDDEQLLNDIEASETLDEDVEGLAKELTEEFWAEIWNICGERMIHNTAAKQVSLELRDTWLRVMDMQCLPVDTTNAEEGLKMFTSDEPPLPLAFDTWSRGVLEILPNERRESVMDPFLRDGTGLLNPSEPAPSKSVMMSGSDEVFTTVPSERNISSANSNVANDLVETFNHRLKSRASRKLQDHLDFISEDILTGNPAKMYFGLDNEDEGSNSTFQFDEEVTEERKNVKPPIEEDEKAIVQDEPATTHVETEYEVPDKAPKGGKNHLVSQKLSHLVDRVERRKERIEREREREEAMAALEEEELNRKLSVTERHNEDMIARRTYILAERDKKKSALMELKSQNIEVFQDLDDFDDLDILEKRPSERKKSTKKKTRPTFEDRWSEKGKNHKLGYEGLVNLKKGWGRTAVVSKGDASSCFQTDTESCDTDKKCTYWFSMQGSNTHCSDNNAATNTCTPILPQLCCFPCQHCPQENGQCSK